MEQRFRALRLAEGQEFASPDHSGGFHGKHTVQGGILTRYLQLGADHGLLGAPVSEETPIKGGAVSYSRPFLWWGGPFGSGSTLYYGPGTPAPSVHEVHGCIYHEYARQAARRRPWASALGRIRHSGRAAV